MHRQDVEMASIAVAFAVFHSHDLVWQDFTWDMDRGLRLP